MSTGPEETRQAAPTEAAGSTSQVGAANKTAATNPSTFGIVTANVTTATPQTTTAAATDATEPTVPLAGLPVAIASRAQAGSSQFDIRLDPPELGRIEVQLSVDSNGQVVSHITADRQDTLNLLQQNSASLTQALRDAGLSADSSSLSFNLRGGGSQFQQPSPGGNVAGGGSTEGDNV